MSHWTKIKTKLRNMEMVKKALGRMGIEYQEGTFTIGRYGNKEQAQLKLDEHVGLSQQEDGTFAMVGDFYYSKNQKLRQYYNNSQKFTADLTTGYAIEEAKQELEDKQFFCTENENAEVGEDGMIRMTFENWG